MPRGLVLAIALAACSRAAPNESPAPTSTLAPEPAFVTFSSGSLTLGGFLYRQSDDVMAAIAYVAALPYVDPKRIASVGCWYGGIMSLLAAERGTGIVAAVDFAGAAIMWSKNAPLRERLQQ